MQLAKFLHEARARIGSVDSEQTRLWVLIYLGFLFLPFLSQPARIAWVLPTLISIPIFLAVYLHAYYKGATVTKTLAVALIGFALAPVNPYATVYLIYSAALAPFAFSIRRALLYTTAMIAVYSLECVFTHTPLTVLALTALLSFATCIGCYVWIETDRKNAVIRTSHEEIRRLATLAERERIGRDLHDLLGHTLSLIAIKSELAEKLVRRDVESAAREIAEVRAIAREALKEVRTAVSGFRAAALEGELAAARALLGSSGVALTAPKLDVALPSDVESGMAMIVREAVTNIHRHSGAQHAAIEIHNDTDAVVLVVRDDGKGGIVRHGNGLTGIGERVRSLAGTLDIESSPGQGTVVSARLPLPARS
jgi:two-component system sensor histidine kinase DesK